MVSGEVDRELGSGPEVTPMSEIRRWQGMPLDEYAEQYPLWADWMRNSSGLMYDADGNAWVARWDPEHGAPIGCEDEDGLTPDKLDALIELSRRAVEEVRAGGGVDFAELDADESFWVDD